MADKGTASVYELVATALGGPKELMRGVAWATLGLAEGAIWLVNKKAAHDVGVLRRNLIETSNTEVDSAKAIKRQEVAKAVIEENKAQLEASQEMAALTLEERKAEVALKKAQAIEALAKAQTAATEASFKGAVLKKALEAVHYSPEDLERIEAAADHVVQSLNTLSSKGGTLMFDVQTLQKQLPAPSEGSTDRSESPGSSPGGPTP